jgi:hypothetical protein
MVNDENFYIDASVRKNFKQIINYQPKPWCSISTNINDNVVSILTFDYHLFLCILMILFFISCSLFWFISENMYYLNLKKEEN